MDEMILTQIDDRGVAHIILNRPDVHNAFNAEVIGLLHDAFCSLGQNEDVRAIVLRAEGRSFSAGADLGWMKDAANWSIEDNLSDAGRLSAMLDAFNSCPKPTIALVQGAAFGGGVGLVACADIALGTAHAKFALSEVRLGILPATISPYVIAAIGPRQARRYFQTAERFDAREAQRIGLLHEILADEQALGARAEEIIAELLKGGPQAQAASKQLVFNVTGRDINYELRRETAESIAKHRTSIEGQEGLRAFFEKRPAAWINSDKKS
ncbi:MAG: enoyl-CoA hydratase-related protein [Sphingomonadales bacterium]|jgi:methylglutaconyl-CoA hydratase